MSRWLTAVAYKVAAACQGELSGETRGFAENAIYRALLEPALVAWIELRLRLSKKRTERRAVTERQSSPAVL